MSKKKTGVQLNTPMAEFLRVVHKSPEVIKTIRGSGIMIEFMEETGFNSEIVDPRMVNDLKDRYKDLELDMLLALWFDSYHTMHFKQSKEKHNTCSYLAANKVVAIGTIIRENF